MGRYYTCTECGRLMREGLGCNCGLERVAKDCKCALCSPLNYADWLTAFLDEEELKLEPKCEPSKSAAKS